MTRRLLLKMPQGRAEAAELIAMLGDLYGLSAPEVEPEPMREAHEGLWCEGLKYVHTYRDDRGIIEIAEEVHVSAAQGGEITRIRGVSAVEIRTNYVSDMYVESDFSHAALEKVKKILDLG